MRSIVSGAVLSLVCLCAFAQGPTLIVGIDTEYGIRPGNVTHGTIPMWSGVINTGLLSLVTNGQNGILVVGGGKSPGDEMTSFWTQVGAALGQPVTFANGNQISTVPFNVAMIAVVNSTAGTGRLTTQELAFLNARQAAVQQFLCNGGAVFASSCNFTNAYQYLAGVTPVAQQAAGYSSITPTPLGSTMGLVNAIPGPWHTVFTSFPPFLNVLATAGGTGGGQVAAIGGTGVLLPQYTIPKQRFCLGEHIIADPTSSVGAVNAFWSIQESDINWNRFGIEAMGWTNAPPAVIDLTNFATERGLTFKCNTYYRVKLAVGGICEPWKETTQLVFISCTSVNAGPDQCCGKSTKLGVAAADGNVSYSWSPGMGLSSTTVKNPMIIDFTAVTPSRTYTVTTVNGDGCSASDSVTVYCGIPKPVITENRSCCSATLTVSGALGIVNWSNGSQASSITVNEGGTYTVTVTNPCGSGTASVVVSPFPNTNGYPDLIAPTGFNAGSDVFKIFHLGLNEGDKPAYNATEWQLHVFDRWGGDHLVSQGQICEIPNGAIQWDGRINGNLVQQDTYNYKLMLKNCNGTEKWSHVWHKRRLVCTKRDRWRLFCFCRPCIEWTNEEYTETKDVQPVTVVR
jgi:hypothetical protein